MREITSAAVRAFMNDESFRRDNTEVVVDTTAGCTTLFLHGNAIAKRDEEGLKVTTADWDTATTRERLNGLPRVRVNRERGNLILNNERWDGNWKNIS